MFHVRRDQENIVRGPPPKTPGFAPKTPAPRERAPLGAKSTNLKARALQTPGFGKADKLQLKTPVYNSASGRKAKLKVHAEPAPSASVIETDTHLEEQDDDSDVPSVELCPSPIKPMPDFPDESDFDLDINVEFSQYRNGQIVESDGLTRGEREEEERQQKMIEQELKEFEDLDLDAEFARRDALHLAKLRQDSLQRPEPIHKRSASARTTAPQAKGTLRPRDVATHLGSAAQPRFAAPTAAARARQASSNNSSAAPVAVASSGARGTIGYARGRKVSRDMRTNPFTAQGRKEAPQQAVKMNERSTMSELLGTSHQQDVAAESVPLPASSMFADLEDPDLLFLDEDDDEPFQLDLAAFGIEG